MTRIIVMLAFLAVYPWVAGEYYVNLASQIMIAALFASSLNLLVGYGGMTSLGHATYLGLSAYVSAWTFLKLGYSTRLLPAPRCLPPPPSLVCSAGWHCALPACRF